MAENKDLDYLYVLKALYEIPFPVGRRLIMDFLKGDRSKQINQHGFSKLKYFGTMGYTDSELSSMINNLISNGILEYKPINDKSFIKALHVTFKGMQEMTKPTLHKKRLAHTYKEIETAITEKERALFEAFKDFLEGYNDGQKKAIISNAKNILCLAGAGSGKTTVLTKRIEFMVKYRSVNPSKILAITFTRKARQQMRAKLDKISGMDLVKVETFNSFCEKLLRKYNDIIYDKPISVIAYRDKIVMISKALKSLGLTIDQAISEYFSYAQIRGKTKEQLSNILLNDAFFVRDYFKFKNRQINAQELDISNSQHEKAGKLFFGICNYIESYMDKHGLRDFADQLIDTIRLFESNFSAIPDFDHILVDEYQDVNSTQIKILDILNPTNLFVVGDPRQSIYGWRGSDIKYILNFQDIREEAQAITLDKNYRSLKKIIDLSNQAIGNMGLPDLKSNTEEEGIVKLLNFADENSEDDFVIETIKNGVTPLNEIFVLARTNRRLNELSLKFRQNGIEHIVRSGENKKTVEPTGDAVVLSTVHAIKGLEAETVFIIGCTPNQFPCINAEHPVIEMVKIDEYDKEEEERRVFYVAMSRAKKNLIMTYATKNHTSYLTPKMSLSITGKEASKNQTRSTMADYKSNSKQGDMIDRLKTWRLEKCKEKNVPAYIIFNDKTLIDLCQKMPLDLRELEEINGFGPAKIRLYGEEILDMINGC